MLNHGEPCDGLEEWKATAERFSEKHNFPNCLGALDGKHVRIRAPNRSGSQYFNYKKYHSIILLASCDADKNFNYVDIGAFGSQSDGGVLAKSTNLRTCSTVPSRLKPLDMFHQWFFYI